MITQLSYEIVLILVCSGLVVGFINTLAGGASIFSITVFMMLGMPLPDANGTNRIPVILQNMTSSLTFIRQKILDVRLALMLSIPTIIGNIVGSQIAATINESVFRMCLGVVLFLVLLIMVFGTEKRLKGGTNKTFVIKPVHYFWFLLIGLYGGYIYVGVGYLILGATLLSMKMDIVTANAVKGFVVLVSAPFALAVFVLNDEVHYAYGLIHAVGNIVGAYVASRYAIRWGVKFLRIFVAVVILISMADLIGLISLRSLLLSVLG